MPEVGVKQLRVEAAGGHELVVCALLNDLSSGTYIVDIDHAGLGTAKGLPTEVQILGGSITRSDPKLDTRIR